MQKLKHKNLMDLHVAELFLDAKKQILQNSEYSPKHKIKALFNLLIYLIII